MQAAILVIFNLLFMADLVQDFGCSENLLIYYHANN